MSRDFATQALRLALCLFALIGEMPVARRGLFDVAESCFSLKPFALKPRDSLWCALATLCFFDAFLCLRVLFAKHVEFRIYLLQLRAFAQGARTQVAKTLTLTL